MTRARWIGGSVVAVILAAGCHRSHPDAEPPPPPPAEGAEDAGDPPPPPPPPPRPDAGPPAEPDAGIELGVPLPPDRDCEPGTRRWCSDATYDHGTQTCLPDGRWGPCIEPTVTADGLVDRPATACGCRYFYLNEDCCEDQEDRDADGHPDCLIPEDYVPPDCSGDGGLCSWCDVHTDCGGDADMCLFRRDGYSFCSRDCSTEPCPDGWTCMLIATRTGEVHQCTPIAETCGDEPFTREAE